MLSAAALNIEKSGLNGNDATCELPSMFPAAKFPLQAQGVVQSRPDALSRFSFRSKVFNVQWQHRRSDAKGNWRKQASLLTNDKLTCSIAGVSVHVHNDLILHNVPIKYEQEHRISQPWYRR